MSENGQLIEGKTVHIEPADVLRGSIEDIEDAIAALMARRDQIDAEAKALDQERVSISETIKEAGKKATRLRSALALVEEASALAPNLPALLKPDVAGEEAPPASKPAASTNGTPPPSSVAAEDRR